MIAYETLDPAVIIVDHVRFPIRPHLRPKRVAAISKQIEKDPSGVPDPLVWRCESTGSYFLLSGRQRLQARIDSGCTRVRCIVHACPEDDAALIAFRELAGRPSLRPSAWETAHAILALSVAPSRRSARAVARLTGRGKTQVAAYLKVARALTDPGLDEYLQTTCQNVEELRVAPLTELMALADHFASWANGEPAEPEVEEEVVELPPEAPRPEGENGTEAPVEVVDVSPEPSVAEEAAPLARQTTVVKDGRAPEEVPESKTIEREPALGFQEVRGVLSGIDAAVLSVLQPAPQPIDSGDPDPGHPAGSSLKERLLALTTWARRVLLEPVDLEEGVARRIHSLWSAVARSVGSWGNRSGAPREPIGPLDVR